MACRLGFVPSSLVDEGLPDLILQLTVTINCLNVNVEHWPHLPTLLLPEVINSVVDSIQTSFIDIRNNTQIDLHPNLSHCSGILENYRLKDFAIVDIHDYRLTN